MSRLKGNGSGHVVGGRPCAHALFDTVRAGRVVDIQVYDPKLVGAIFGVSQPP